MTADKIEKLFTAVETISSEVAEISDTVNGELTQSIDNTITMYDKYMGKIDARLQEQSDAGKHFSTLAASINSTLAQNPYIKQTALIENLSKLTEAGINYNLEQRAYLTTLSDKMVTTFNVLDSTLTRLVRIQQADVTLASMGAEARITQLLNSMYQDTSYLGSSGGSGIYDAVSEAIFDATAQLNYSEGTSYMYNVQKWLGSLYSAGMSDSTIRQLAQGINYLTTGNVSELTNNDKLNTLFGLAASKGGLNYEDMLTQGLNATGVNKLLYSIVNLLSSINSEATNQVTKSELSKVVGVSLSDIKAATTVQADAVTLLSNTITYADALSEVNDQLNLITKRTGVTERIDNVLANIITSTGASFALQNDQEGYFDWKKRQIVTGIISDIGGSLGGVVGGIVKGFSSLVSMLDTVHETGGIGGLITRLGGLSSDNIFSESSNLPALFGYGWNQFTSRGDISGGILGYSGSTTGVSYSSSITSSAISDIESVSLAEQAANTSAYNVSGSASGVVRSASDIYSELFELQSRAIRVKLASVEDEALDTLYEKFEVEKQRKNVEDLVAKILDGTFTVDLDGSATGFGYRFLG